MPNAIAAGVGRAWSAQDVGDHERDQADDRLDRQVDVAGDDDHAPAPTAAMAMIDASTVTFVRFVIDRNCGAWTRHAGAHHDHHHDEAQLALARDAAPGTARRARPR